MKNIGSILDAAGVSYKNIIKTTIFLPVIKNISCVKRKNCGELFFQILNILKDLKDIPEVTKVLNNYFPDGFPAGTFIGVAELPRKGNFIISLT